MFDGNLTFLLSMMFVRFNMLFCWMWVFSMLFFCLWCLSGTLIVQKWMERFHPLLGSYKTCKFCEFMLLLFLTILVNCALFSFVHEFQLLLILAILVSCSFFFTDHTMSYIHQKFVVIWVCLDNISLVLGYIWPYDNQFTWGINISFEVGRA